MTSWVIWGIVLVIVVSVAATALVFVTKRIIPKERRQADLDAIGLVFAVVGVLYAIVLAFVVMDVWQKMTTAEEATYREATALIEQYRYAATLPAPQRAEIQRLSRAYVDHVMNVEWKHMRLRERPGIEGDGMVDNLREAVVRAKGPNDLVYEEAVGHGQALAAAREARLASAVSGVPAVMWFVLIGGGLLMISFVYIFDIAGAPTQSILAIGLTVMTVLLLWSVFQMEYPFGRQLHLDPEAFEFALTRFTQITRGG